MSHRLFVDMDGTLAVFRPVTELETLYEQGYFLNLPPQTNVVEAVRELINKESDIEVFVLSSYLSDSAYALEEKNKWLDEYLPEVKEENRLFVPCGMPKKAAISHLISENDVLLDDYTKNLLEWQPPGKGVKLLNGINHTKGTWMHDRIRSDRQPSDIAFLLSGILHKQIKHHDMPLKANRKEMPNSGKKETPKMKL